MALIAMAVYDTDENKRSEYTEKTLDSLLQTVDFTKHRLFIIDNASCLTTKQIYKKFEQKWLYPERITIFFNTTNIGTAEAINMAIKERKKGEPVIKIDNDVVFHTKNWACLLEEGLNRDKSIGIIAAKRKDLQQSPLQTNPTFISVLMMLPHSPGERWLVLEETKDIMGTCTLFSPLLLDKIGYMQQIPNIPYGFDDTIISFKSIHSGFRNGFLMGIEIDHIDRGDNNYLQEKQKLASLAWDSYIQLIRNFELGASLYYSPYEN